MKIIAKLFRDNENDEIKSCKNNTNRNSQSPLKGDSNVIEAIKAVIEIEETNEIGKYQESTNLFEAKL